MTDITDKELQGYLDTVIGGAAYRECGEKLEHAVREHVQAVRRLRDHNKTLAKQFTLLNPILAERDRLRDRVDRLEKALREADTYLKIMWETPPTSGEQIKLLRSAGDAIAAALQSIAGEGCGYTSEDLNKAARKLYGNRKGE